MSNIVTVTGLWPAKNKDSKVVMSGQQGQVQYIVFRNSRYEEGSNMPKYNLCIAQVEKRNNEAKTETTGEEELPF